MKLKLLALTSALGLVLPLALNASSHREAPQITEMPKVDATDFYMFNSYESGREGYITLIANYLPLQDAYGGPNYFALDDDAIYEIHIDNNADAVEDITFQFNFSTTTKGITLSIGGEDVAVPIIQVGGVGPTQADSANLNVIENYSVTIIRGDRRTGSSASISNAIDSATSFVKPVDYIGTKTIAAYSAYANDHIYDISIPDCDDGRLFVGQRKEGFVVNLGGVF
ncbi:DUF4331 family protein, partial [bacterium AH-315-K03]|nr:DUF4331 family protein [bacterium AH-315-K03]